MHVDFFLHCTRFPSFSGIFGLNKQISWILVSTWLCYANLAMSWRLEAHDWRQRWWAPAPPPPGDAVITDKTVEFGWMDRWTKSSRFTCQLALLPMCFCHRFFVDAQGEKMQLMGYRFWMSGAGWKGGVGEERWNVTGLLLAIKTPEE